MMDKTCLNHLEHFLLLGKSAEGAACAELLMQALETPGLYVFGELLDLANIEQLKAGEHSKHYELLELFAYGKYNDYINAKDNYPALNDKHINKLRHLTIMTLASNKKCLPYNILLDELGYSSLRELEDSLIEVINSGIVAGRLDQQEQHLQVEYAVGRDVRKEGVANILRVLSDCCSTCAQVLQNIEELAREADHTRLQAAQKNLDVEKEMQKMKSCMKASSHADTDDDLSLDLTSSSDKVAGKKGKIKLTIKSSQSSGSFSSPKAPK